MKPEPRGECWICTDPDGVYRLEGGMLCRACWWWATMRKGLKSIGLWSW